VDNGAGARAIHADLHAGQEREKETEIETTWPALQLSVRPLRAHALSLTRQINLHTAANQPESCSGVTVAAVGVYLRVSAQELLHDVANGWLRACRSTLWITVPVLKRKRL